MTGLDTYNAMAIQAAGAIASNVVSGRHASRENRKAREWNEKMYYQQLEDNRKNWEMMNEYNLPSAVRQRYEDANLNPLLLYGDGGVSGAVANTAAESGKSGSPSPLGFNAQNPFAGLAMTYLQSKDIEADIALKRSQANLNDKSAEESSSRKENIDFDLAFKKDMQEIEKIYRISEYDLNKSLQSLNIEQKYYLRKQTDKIDAEVQEVYSRIINAKNLNDAQVKDILDRLDLYKQEFPHVIANLDSQTRLNYANAYAARVAAMIQEKTYDDDYIKIIQGKAGQDFLNALKYGTQLDIENGIKGLEFLSRPQNGSPLYKIRNFFDYIIMPSTAILKDAALGTGAVMMGAGRAPFKVAGFKP